jgi:tetratricopeptide (TPR) repeat protein
MNLARVFAVRCTIAVTCAGALLVGAWQIVRLGVADTLSQQNSRIPVARARRMFPSNPSFIIRSVELRQKTDKDIYRDLEQAAKLDPDDPWIHLNLGVALDARGDGAGAEKQWLEAARLCRQYEPRWQLAKYYYHQQDGIRSGRWLREALKIGTGDATLAFLMALRLGWTSEDVMTLLPKGDVLLLQYLNWLTDQKQFDMARAVAREVARLYPRSGKDSLLLYCGRLSQVDNESLAKAAEVWNDLAAAHVIGSDEAVFPARPAHVVNAAFRRPPLAIRLDWDIIPVQGVNGYFTGNGLQLEFAGDEPETCRYLHQFVSVKPGEDYTLQYDYDSSGLAPNSGASWHVLAAVSRQELVASPPVLSDEAQHQTLRFHTPGDCRFVELVLQYQRPRGVARIEGWVLLKKVDIEPAAKTPAA